MKNKWKIGDLCGCIGEGDSIYMVISVDKDTNTCYLRAYGNTKVEGGWNNTSDLLKIKNMKKVEHYEVEFF
jgi:hypothetical protein